MEKYGGGGGEINPLLLKRILHEAYEMGLRRVGLYTTGEMFMCMEVETHVRNAKEIGYEYIYADTNGALATKENLTKVINAGLDSIKFSINAAQRQTYAQIHGHDDLEKVLKNLETCYALKKKLNPKLKILVSFVVTSQTQEEVDLLRVRVAPYVDKFLVHPVLPFYLQTDDDIRHLAVKSETPATTTYPCLMVMDRVHVTYDGFLTACCVDFKHDLLLADLKTTALKDAWFSENAVNFRKRHVENQIEGTMCHGCLKGRFIPYEPLFV